jgi:hypothetical protein
VAQAPAGIARRVPGGDTGGQTVTTGCANR